MSLFGNIGTNLIDASPIGAVNAIVNKVSGGHIGVDPTYNYGLQSSLGNLLSSHPATQKPASQPSGRVGDATSSTQYSPPGSGSGGSGAGSSAYSIDPSIYQYYDALANSANSQLGRLDTQAQIGQQNVDQGYNQSLDSLNSQKAVTDRNYNTSKDQTLQDYVGSKGSIQAGVGQNANGLQRLLAAHGYTGSANTAANYAAARQGAVQNNQVQQTYGRNQQALDTNYGDFMNQYNGSVSDLGRQHSDQLNQLHAQIAQNKSDLLGQLSQIAQQRASAAPGATYGSVTAAMQPYAQQINALGGQIDQLGRNASYTPKAATYQAPTLQQYAPTQTSAAQVNGAPGAADQVSPFLSVLLGQQKDKNNLNNLS